MKLSDIEITDPNNQDQVLRLILDFVTALANAACEDDARAMACKILDMLGG